ncbi:hypothetical protein RQP46_011246 [Phenoliferia psychrophenolica]
MSSASLPDNSSSEKAVGTHIEETKEDVLRDTVLASGEDIPNSWSTWFVATYMAFCLFTFSLSLSVTTSQSTFIAQDIGGSAITSWFGQSALIAATVAFPVAFYISDFLGRKKLMGTGFILGFVGSLVGGRATSPAMVIAGLTLLGLGVGFSATALVAISDVVPVRQRGFFLGILDIGGGMSNAFGPLIGGALTSNTVGSWHNCFYLVAALNAVCGIGLFGFHPRYEVNGSTLQVLAALDWGGVAIYVAACVLTLTGLSNSILYPWSSALVVGPLVSGLCMLVIFGIWVAYKNNAIIKKTLWTFFNFPMVMFIAWLSGWLLYGFAAFLPSMLALYYHADAFRVGVILMVQNGIYIVATPVFSMSISLFRGSYRPLLFACFISGVIACALVSTITPDDPVQKFLGYSVFLGLASAGCSGMSLVISQYSAIQSDLGVAVGLTNATRTFGGALSIAIFNTILAKKVAAGLPPASIPAMIGALASGNAAAVMAVPGVTAASAAAGAKAFLESYVYIVTAAFMGLGAVVTLLMHPIKSERLTDVVPVKMGAFGTGADLEKS